MSTSDRQPRHAGATTIANVEQAAAWDGEEGDRWVEYSDRYEATARGYGPRLLTAAQISPGRAVLDIGCGIGGSTRSAARLAAPAVALGVDLSTRMLEEARRRGRAEGLANVRFEHGDAQVYPFEAQTFDIAMSRFGAMFFGDPVAAFSNIGRALRPGARLAILAWQELSRNEWLTALRAALAAGRVLPEPPSGAPGPFGLADADKTRRILAASGYEDIELQEVSEPINLGTDADDAFAFGRTMGFTKGMLQDLDEGGRELALEDLRATLVAHETPEGVLFGSRAWLITARHR